MSVQITIESREVGNGKCQTLIEVRASEDATEEELIAAEILLNNSQASIAQAYDKANGGKGCSVVGKRIG